jgi:outer membrane protein assembly factor BamA
MITRIGIILIACIHFSAYTFAFEFEGIHHYSDKQLAGFVNPNASDDSLARKIESLYQKAGYFKAHIQSITVDNRGQKTVHINEGSASLVDSLDIITIPININLDLSAIRNEIIGTAASETNFDNFANYCIAYFSENGYPFASGQWLDFKFNAAGNIIAAFRVAAGLRMHIVGARFRGLKRTRPETLNRAMDISPGELYSEKRISDASRLIDAMPYIDIAGPPRIEPVGDYDSCLIVYDIRELPSTKFDGAAGIVTVKNKSSVVGRLNLEFGDLFGTGRAFGLLWNRKDKFSSEFRLHYLEPFLFNSRFDLKLEAFQNDKDSSYIENGVRADLIHSFGGGLSGNIYFAIQRTVPESGSIVQRSLGRYIGFSFDLDKTDLPENPRTGYGIASGLTYKYRSNQGVAADSLSLPKKLTSAEIEFRYYLKAFDRFVTAFRLSYWGIVSSDGNIPRDELKYIGGIENLRGYSEGQFPAYRYGIATVEPRLLAGRKSRVYAFWDMAEIKASDLADSKFKFYNGYGLGAVAPSTLGQFKLEIGWGKDGFPKDAFINFGLAGRF